MDYSEVLKKVRKLFALAKNNTNDHEAALALARAKELVDKYEIAEEDLHHTTFDVICQHRSFLNQDELLTWQRLIVCAFAEWFGCRALLRLKPSGQFAPIIDIIGREPDIVIMQTAVDKYLIRASCSAALAYDQYFVSFTEQPVQSPTGLHVIIRTEQVMPEDFFKESFLLGWADTLTKRLHQMILERNRPLQPDLGMADGKEKEEREFVERGLVLSRARAEKIDDFMAQHYPNLTQASLTPINIDMDAFYMGATEAGIVPFDTE